MKLLILGAGGHGKVVSEIALLMKKWDDIYFLDDNKVGQEINGIKVIGTLDKIKELRKEFTHAFVSIGDNMKRVEWFKYLEEMNYEIPVLIHPSSIISNNVKINKGTVIMPGSIINTNTVIGKACIINTNASIDHDCQIGDGVHISPGVTIGGSVNIGDNTWVCIGATIINNINIGKNCIIAAGSTVIRDVPDNVMIAGVPGEIKKIIKLNETR
ncbi:acetyltransferase [Caldicellulosiruptor morganii]|uniref:Acetyltransferase n=1 Tax=Caldicellulosiruptor morganii TaxID=1387555 RepID=A0ABY7BLC2_9FIRM|nr:acetyltransferase [Caldicellulosiruptor morganii]WAM33638.1 acetyltransferase [Caldicellulosiruptor morganii]